MGIEDEDLERVRRDSDIVSIVTQYTQLRKVGRRFQGLCPFHSERSPSFSVNAEEGLYYCFGCAAKGDVITFVREKEQLDFVGAVEWLAAKAGITLRYTNANEGENRRRRSRLHEAVGQAADWYHERLLSADDAGAARSYLRSRGYDGDTVRRFKIGWAPDDWDRLARSLRLSDDDLTDSGLGFINRRGRQQDAFRGRVMFPVFDAQDNAVGFGGRILPGADGPKYKNSSESTVYAKSRLLYGLNWAKTEVVEEDEVVVCEGYTDVIGFATAGVARAVATCGTALTEDHVKLLRRFARRVVLAFDADSAGQEAAARFYEWERSHDLDVAVANLPAGVDPGDLARNDPDRLVKSVKSARPFLEFRVERALDAGNLDSAEGRARAAEAALAMVREHPDPLVRDQYAMTVASRCRLDLDLVRAQLSAGPSDRSSGADGGGNRSRSRRSGDDGDARPNRATGFGEQTAKRSTIRSQAELEALRLAAGGDEMIRRLVLPDLFRDELAATTFVLLGTGQSLHSIIAEGGPEVAELVQMLSVEESQADPEGVAGLLWGAYLDLRMADFKDELRRADPDDQPQIVREHTWLKIKHDELRSPGRQASTIDELLGWMDGAQGQDGDEKGC